MNTLMNKAKMVESGHYVVGCDNCGKAMHAPEVTYWKVLSDGTYRYYCGAECSLVGHQGGYTRRRPLMAA